MSFVRRSGRINPNYNSNQSPNPNQYSNPLFSGYNAQQNQTQYQKKEEEKPFEGQRYFNNPQLKQESSQPLVEPKEEVKSPQKPSQDVLEVPTQESNVPAADTSATTKALNKMEVDGAEKTKRWKNKKSKRKKLNQRLSRLLVPKSAIIFLHELKPCCVYKVQEQTGVSQPVFVAHVEDNGEVLGTGQGMSKSQAKNTAAENAIKSIISKTMAQGQETKKKEKTEGEEMDEDDNENGPENLPWAGLASFAMYKMFLEWQIQGTDLPLVKPAAKTKPKTAAKCPTAKKDLPPNAAEMHPAGLLNMMKPGITAVEVNREFGTKCRVTMGYSIDGQMYTGVAGNKKDARKEAAKAALACLYGMVYPS